MHTRPSVAMLCVHGLRHTSAINQHSIKRQTSQKKNLLGARISSLKSIET